MVARKTSNRSGGGDQTDEDQRDAGATDDLTTEAEQATAEDSATTDEPGQVEAAPTEEPPEATEPSTDDSAEPGPTPEPAADPTPAPQRVIERRGPGFLPLVLGGVVAAGIGYGTAYLGYLPVPSDDTALVALSDTVDGQGTQLAALDTRASGIEAQIAGLPEIPEVDFSPLETQIADLNVTMQEMATQIAALEARPILSGEGTADEAAMAAAMAELQANLQEQQTANAALAEQIAAAAADAEARIAAAEERAQSRVGTATAQAALSQLRISVAAGNPFAEALNDVAANAGVDVPDGLAAAAETGVPTLEELQAGFPAVARAALPVALRETAGDDTMGRLGAFVRGQVGGRSLEPREGHDPDAILSRAEAAVAAGDLTSALGELEALPEPARDQMAIWITEAQTRLAATEALDAFSAALDGAN